MSKIFRKHFEAWANRTFKLERKMDQLTSKLSNFKTHKNFTDELILHRFPRKELRYFLRLECPTERDPEVRGIKDYEIIKAAKRLRYTMNIPESFVCKSCTKREKCKFRDQLPPKKGTSVHDLLLVTTGLYNYNKLVYPDEKTQVNENEENEEAVENENEAEENLEQEELSEKEDGNESDQENIQLKDRYTFKMWTSATIVLDTLYPVMEDILQNKAINSREFINAYVAARKENIAQKRGDIIEGSEDEEADVEAESDAEEESSKKPQGGRKIHRKQVEKQTKGMRGNQKKQELSEDEDEEDIEEPVRGKAQKGKSKFFHKENKKRDFEEDITEHTNRRSKSAPNAKKSQQEKASNSLKGKEEHKKSSKESGKNEENKERSWGEKPNKNVNKSQKQSSQEKEQRKGDKEQGKSNDKTQKPKNQPSDVFDRPKNLDKFMHNVKI